MFLAKQYIRNKEDAYQCSFCFESSFEMMVCSGPCQKQLCRRCFKAYGYRGTCRFCQRISEPIFLPLKEVDFCCPSEQCTPILKSQREFDRHSEQCIHLPKETREQFYFKLTFRCTKGHKLLRDRSGGPCSICLEQICYTTQCSTCKEKSCTICMPLPCSKKECPVGHELIPFVDRGTITCDICGITIRKLGEKRVFSDRTCNFDVCLGCHNKLPNEHPLPEYKQPGNETREAEGGSNLS